jgi:translocation protein SEC63
MSSDYSYDEEGTLWPFFVFTLSGLVTLPLSYVLFNRTRDPAASFPRIKSEYRPKNADLIEATRKKDKRRESKIWLVLLVLLGWSVMAYTMYLIYVTPSTVRSIWNPYDILGISEVRTLHGVSYLNCSLTHFIYSLRARRTLRASTGNCRAHSTPIRPSLTLRRMRPLRP